MNKNCPKFFHWKHVLPTQSERMMHLRKYWKISEMFKILANINLFRCRQILKILKIKKKHWKISEISKIFENINLFRCRQISRFPLPPHRQLELRMAFKLKIGSRVDYYNHLQATILIIPSVIHILIVRRLAQQTAFWTADYFADHNYHYYHHYYCQ